MAALDLGKTGLLQGNGVIGVEVIDPDHLFAPFQQSQRRMEADEPCGSGNKHGHSSSSLLLRLDQSCQRRRSGGNSMSRHMPLISATNPPLSTMRAMSSPFHPRYRAFGTRSESHPSD